MIKYAIIVLSIFLTACSANEPAAIDYALRLQNVLGIKMAYQKTNQLKPPSPRDLQQSTQSSILTIREFLSLRQCELHTVIAHRNSLIGKVSKPSQILLNDLDILKTGPACIEVLEQKSIANKLAIFLNTKQQQIKQSVWNATIAGPEFQLFWSTNALADNYPTQLKKETIENLHAIAKLNKQIGQGNYTLSVQQKQQLETDLGNIRFGDGGQLILEYQMMIDGLNLANRAIEYRLQTPLCLNGKPTPAARNMQNVVFKYFIDGVQQHAVKLRQRTNQIMPTINKLEEQFKSILPKNYKAWQQQRNELIQTGQTKVTDHAKMLQKLFKQCGLSVGNKQHG